MVTNRNVTYRRLPSEGRFSGKADRTASQIRSSILPESWPIDPVQQPIHSPGNTQMAGEYGIMVSLNKTRRSLSGTTNCDVVDGGARRRHGRPSESIDKFPNCSYQDRNSRDSPAQSDQDGAESDWTHTRRVVNVLSSRDAAIKSGSDSAGGRSAVTSSR